MSNVISYRQAINEALTEEMERDSSVFIYGIDVGDHDCIFKTVTGLREKFGPGRCFSTPLCEDTLVGFGLGAALNGLRPINVHMRIDFLLLAMNQLINMAASFRFGSGDKLKVPLVIRTIIGRGWGQSYQHSKSLQSFFAHIPGLKIVMPTTPSDAKGLLISAIRDDSPVVVIEHRWLYDAVDEVPITQEPIPIGQPRILREGTDVTVIGTSWMNVESLKAADVLAKQKGIKIEVIDPRTISPLDDFLMIQSVKKTGHCIIADYDWLNCGFSAEMAARIYEKCFNRLKSPIKRIGFADTHCPCSRPLENMFYPTAIDIIRAVEENLKLPKTDLSGENFYSYENKFRGPF